MFVEGSIWVVAGFAAPSQYAFARAVQVSPSLAAAGLGATVAAAVVWLLATFLLGRVYCSSVCPLGTLQDAAIRVRRFLPGGSRRRFAYKRPNRRRFIMLGIYAIALVSASGIVPLLLEPWPSFVNLISQASGHGMHYSLVPLGVGGLWGGLCAVASVLLVLVLMPGRDFCNDVCPVGTVLRLASNRTLMHIELYPDRCTSCLKCQDACKASCIDIKTRTIDNARCVRCFNCLAVCEDDAIRFTTDRGGVAGALFQRSRQFSN